MATVKVKLRPSTVPGKAGTIYYQLTHLRQVKQITTKIHLHPKNWDSNNTQIIFTDSTSYLLQCKIDRDLDRLKKIICKMDTECANYTVNEIIEKFHQTNSDYTITDFFTKQIQKLKNDNRRGTARNYNKTLKSLKAFMKNNRFNVQYCNRTICGKL